LVLDEQVNKYQALDDWFHTPQGYRVAQAFASEIKDVSNVLSGKRLLQLGSCGENLWLPLLKYRQKWLLTPCMTSTRATFYASIHELPLDKNSMDCVIAPLTLEAFAHDKNPIDEIDRILKPMGYVIFFGINPWSFWGAALRWGRLACFGDAAANLSSSLFIKRAMVNRGYSQCALNSFYYIPPVTNEKFIHALEFFNQMGKMLWPFPAGFYYFIAQKHQPCQPPFILHTAEDDFHFARA
jgi:hypothetical protein